MNIDHVFEDAVDLLKELVRIPSLSGEEDSAATFLEQKLKEYFPGSVTRKGHNIVVDIEGQKESPTLLLCSHIDTVEPVEGWTYDPFGAEVAGDKIYGLGSNDAGASLVSMIAAARLMDKTKMGRLILAFVAEEEVGSKGFYTIEPELPLYDAAIFGEPTNLRASTSMRGAMKALIRSRGVGCHASVPWEGKNAVDQLLKDIQAIRSIDLKDESPWGGATIEPTVISGGKTSNQIPALIETTLDIRTTPTKNNEWILEALRQTGVEIEVLFNRRKPMFCDDGSKIVRAYRTSFPHEPECVFDGTCDMAFAKAASIILGPGELKVAHIANEFTRPSEIKKAISVYHNVIGNFSYL